MFNKFFKRATPSREKPLIVPVEEARCDPMAVHPDEAAQRACEQGFAFHQGGELERARSSYETAIALAPRHFDALQLLGIIEQQNGAYARAVTLFERALAVDGNSASCLSNCGLALMALAQWARALASFDAAVAVAPDFATAHFNRGLVMIELRRYPEALLSLNQAIALDPNLADAYLGRGNALRLLERREEALASFDRALAINPEALGALINRGALLHDMKRWPEALASFDKAISIAPNSVQAWTNRATTLARIGKWEAAIECYDRALSINPENAQTHNYRAAALEDAMHLDAALAGYSRAIEIEPENAAARFNRSALLLLRGDFANGWPEYEARWSDISQRLPTRQFAAPLWLGKESLEGKTILLHAEQGLGDAIQFSRYVPLVAQRGARVVLELPRALLPLYAGFEGVSAVVAAGSLLPSFDFHCPLMSLPLAFATDLDSIPARIAYLHADKKKTDAWRMRLGQSRQVLVGLVWSGNPAHKNDHQRSIDLAELLRDLPSGFQYVSLQKDISSDDRKILAEHAEIAHFGEELHDLGETAALCAAMDIVISVDTSVAHLAGALGKVVWVLLPLVPDWRWLVLRSDSPWYPTAKLYRQGVAREWGSVLERVRGDLLARAH